ncbi:DUF4097 family beta strand repeat-containing protein [Anaeromicropila populeti]|uniref:Putative adhesin n=1 Tax=Anaeromicropila populeti TaxID=37658 RepID=A0A1I6I5N6_9FIRM|nr:DUF4097 family beta strand repeat-containing protein [Anaeromicropila populeti]SFR62056.1 Putative adhesin [Anaeromicropila populeti]
MNGAQKVIKYCAMAFGIFLAITIIGAIVSAIAGAFGAFSFFKNVKIHHSSSDNYSVESTNEDGVRSYVFDGIEDIRIEGGVYKLVVKEGPELKVVMDNVSDDYGAKQSGDELVIYSEEDTWFFNIHFNMDKEDTKGTIYLYLPDDFKANKFDLTIGVGTVQLSDLRADTIDIECGVGNLTVENIIGEKVDIQGGVGQLKFKDVNFSDADIEGGVGSIDFSGKLSGKSVVSSGMGSVELSIEGEKDDYEIEVESGLGAIHIDGEKCGDVHLDSSSSKHKLEVDGGVGSINIDFSED